MTHDRESSELPLVHKRLLITSLVGLLTASSIVGFQLAIPVIVGIIVDDALIAGDLESLSRLAGALVAVALGVAAAQIAHDLWFTWRGEMTLEGLQVHTIKRILSLPLRNLEIHHSGRLHHLLGHECLTVSQLGGRLLGQVLLSITQFLGLMALLVIRYGTVSLAVLLVTPLYLVVPLLSRNRVRKAGRLLSAARADVSSSLQEVLLGAVDLKSFGREAWGVNRVRSGFVRRCGARLRYVLVKSTSWVNYVFSFALGAAVYWLGGRSVLNGQLSVGELVALVAIVGYLEGPVARLTRIYIDLQAVHSARDKLGEIEAPVVVTDTSSCRRRVPPGPLDIEFNAVSFRYGGGVSPALDDVSFRIDAGTTVAIVGASGAGKTTLCRLLLRLYSPDSGVIIVAGRPVSDYDPASFRSSVAVIPQEPFLFSDTVAENISLGRGAGSVRKLEDAARLANVDGFLAGLPAGYQTALGERGVGLSGGQQQRVAIARALFDLPGVLIMDEATSALDVLSERTVRSGIEGGDVKKTIIVITHRIHTIRRADKIIVLDRGRVAAYGRHAELLNSCPLYSSFVRGAEREVV